MNNSTSTAYLEEYKESQIDVNDNLELHRDCCIFRVPKVIRKIDAESYTPKVISIGPLHYGNEEFAVMEKQKIRYKREFKKRITPEKWQELISFIEEKKLRIHNCYAEKSTLQNLEFVTMILYDAVFIIELFLRHSCEGQINRDFLQYIARTAVDIRVDLQLLENQLQFFVLDGLYTLAFSRPRCSFVQLSCWFFELPVPDYRVEVKHFIDLRRTTMTKKYPISQSPEYPTNLPCAVKLNETGVKFNRIKGESFLDVRLEKKPLRIPWLKVVELQIPHIDVDDNIECLIRNVMALEQCYYPEQTLVCNYIDLMDMLIDTVEDVNLLVGAGIITNSIGNKARIANMFNKLCLGIVISPSYYADIIKDLNAHHDNRWNHAVATLKTVYFGDLWRGTATVAATAILLLTLIQTICSILQKG